MRISWCSVNARMGAKPVSLQIKSASVNGVLERPHLVFADLERVNLCSHKVVDLVLCDSKEIYIMIQERLE